MPKQRNISDTLREAATKAGETGGIRELARAANVDSATLVRFLSGHRVRSDQLDRIADALGYELRKTRKGKHETSSKG